MEADPPDLNLLDLEKSMPEVNLKISPCRSESESPSSDKMSLLFVTRIFGITKKCQSRGQTAFGYIIPTRIKRYAIFV